jgi:hypothetical protein
MSDDVNFVELICIMNVTPETAVEKLAGIMNSNTFDAFNLAGTLKKKGMIDFATTYPGPNTISLTDAAKGVIAEANAKATEEFDNLDENILVKLYAGKKSTTELQSSLNLNTKDLALRLFKLSKQGYLTYEMKSGNTDFLLTEKGFLKASTSQIPHSAPPKPQGPTPEEQAQQQMQAEAKNQETMVKDINQLKKKPNRMVTVILGLLILIVIVVIVLIYTNRLPI